MLICYNFIYIKLSYTIVFTYIIITLLFHFRLIIVRIVKFYKGVNFFLIFGLSFILFLVAVYVSFV